MTGSNGHGVRSSHGWPARGVALVLSWVMPATTVWSAAPPAPPVAVRADVPLPTYRSFAHLPADPLASRAPAPDWSRPRAAVRPPALSTSSATVVPPLAAAMASLHPSLALPVAPVIPVAPMLMSGGNDDDHERDHHHHCQHGHSHHHHQGTCGCDETFFGPERFVRTNGPKNEYVRTISVPAWVASPFELSVQNGEPDGRNRVSSAWIYVNGQQVASPSDFNQNVAGFDRTVNLTPTTTLKVVLASKPGSYLTLNLCGRGRDHTPPRVTWTAPVPGSTINDTTPVLRVSYQDLTGSGEPNPSGVDLASLVITLDNVNQTSLFTRRATDASAEVPANLALGPGTHHLKATIEDDAGNVGEGVADFVVDPTPPAIQVTQPVRGAYLPTLSPTIRVTYADNLALDLATLEIRVDGTNRTTAFTRGPAEAVATLTLASGAHDVVANIRDRAGNAAVPSSTSFNLDTTPPVVTIGKPLPDSRHGTSQVEAIVQYRDDQALDLSSFRAEVDGAVVTLGQGPEGAMGLLPPLPDGEHTLTARIKDRAGNERTAQSRFRVDTGVPDIQIVLPLSGFILNTATPLVLVTYSDPQGVDLQTFKLVVRDQDRTSSCQVGPDSASCTIPPVPQGESTIRAEIKDLGGNHATAISSFIVDTIAPTGSMTSPGAITNTGAAAITFAYEDAGTGVRVTSVLVRVDGSEPVSWFSAGATSATGVPPAPLSDGLHHVVLTLEDAAGNSASIEGSFTVDTVSPTASVAAPANEAFVNDSTPQIRITYADSGGTGVAIPASVHVFHHQGDDPETEITSLFAVGATEAIGTLPDASALTDGTHHLRVEIKDQAGNARETQSLFVLDTVAPTYTVVAPARDTFVPTKTPAFTITYADDRSGVDTATFVFKVDATDLTARLVPGPTQAAGALQPGDALEEGKHAVSVVISDRAGNAAVPSAHEFVVDTVAPTASVQLPADGAYLGVPQSLVRVAFADTVVPGAGNGVGSVEVIIDGVDRTAEFAGPNQATCPSASSSSCEAQLNPPLGEGSHTVTVNVRDWANNPGAGSSTFFVDLTAPLVTITDPPAGARKEASVVVTGTVADTDPQVVVECSAGGPASPATLAPPAPQRSFTCTLTLADGATEIVATARDRFGREGSDRRRFVLDTGTPVVIIEQPSSGECTAAEAVTVSGTVQDASIDETTTVTVTVEGVTAPCARTSNGSCSFSATVPLGAGPQATLHVQAEDVAGNIGQASVTLCVDREAPTVTIDPPTSPYATGPVLTVHGTVSDTLTPTTVEVNGQPESAPSLALSRSFTVLLPVVDGSVELKATARDAAGNAGISAPVVVNVDATPPQIVFDSPESGTVTRAASIVVSGHVLDASPVTLTRDGQNVPVGTGGAFTVDVPLPGGAIFTAVSLAFAAIDAAGNPGTASFEVIVDRKAPTLTIASPHSGDVLVSLPIVVQGTFEDDTDTTVTVNGQLAEITGHAWQAIFATLPEGPHQFTVSARDKANNTTTAPLVDVVIDLGAPVVAIDAPPTGTLTRESDILVHGTVQETGTVQVKVNGVSASTQRTGPATWTYTVTVPLQEGTQELVALAEDAAHRTDTNDDHVLVTRDSTPPVVVLTAPSQVSRGKPGNAIAVVTDPDLASLTVTWGAVQATCTSSPCTLALTVPEGVASGTTIPATATATDLAGNVGTAPPRGVKVVADGVVTGQVLSDATGLVLEGATVRMTAGVGETSTSSDEDGRYSLPTGEPFATIGVSKVGHTSVERDLAVESGTGTVPVDARLTPLAAAQIVGAEGGILHAPGPVATPPAPRRPALKLTVPSSTVPDGTAFRLTPLSPQGLPGLLPLGWAPVAAYDLQLSSPFAGSLEGVVLFAEGAAPVDPVHLIRYDTSAHAWEVKVRDLTTANNALTASFSQAGAYAFVVADDATVAVPAVGEVLAGVDMVPVPATATSTGSVNPSSVAPTGGIAKGSLEIQSPLPLPSGTVVQAEVGETYTLRETDASGANKVASTEKRLQDIVLFRPKGGAAGSVPPLPANTALGAEVAVTPSRTYGRAEIVKGEVVLDFLAGREGVRGTVGGNEAVDLEAADVRLRVPAHAFGEDTALSLEVPTALSAFLPSVPGLDALSEVVLDFSGKTLVVAAGLSIDAGLVGAGDTVLVAQVERALTDTIPRLAVVARAQLEGGRVTTVPYPGLPGIVEGGRYVFYRSVPVGFVAGTAMAGGSPVRALIEPVLASPWPFIALSRAGGDFILAVPPGTVGLKASVPRTPYAGSASVQVTENETTPFTFALVGAGTILAVTPSDGTVGVPVNVPFEIRSTAPLQPDTVSTQTIRLFKVGTPENTPVAVRLVLAQNRRSVSVIPEPPPSSDPDAPPKPALLFQKSYILEAAGLKDSFGKDVPSVAVTFTTRDDSPEARDLRKLVFSIPDENGIVKITAPEGTLAPGTTILVINSGNGYVLSLSAGNDGEVNGEINASVSDRLLITITDPEGHATSFERSQFFDAATGATVVGEGGGVIEGPGGAELRIPEGALDKPVKLKVTAVTEADYAAAFEGDQRRPDVPLSNPDYPDLAGGFGNALKIEASEETHFKKEVDLAFPVPAELDPSPTCVKPPPNSPPPPIGPKPCAKDAFFQVYRRIEGPCPGGAEECARAARPVYFETVDTAFVEGDGGNRKVVTASYPFTGYRDGWTRWDPIAGAGFESLGGAVGGAAIGGVATAWAMTMWTVTALLPGASVSGVITGRVQWPVFKPGKTDPVYEGVAGVTLRRDDSLDQGATIAFSEGSEGRFTFFDPHFKGGTVEVRAEYNGQIYKGTAFAVERSDTKILTDPGLAPLVAGGYFKNIATVNITLPGPTPAAAAPKFGIHVMKVTNDKRAEVSTVIAGTPLVIGFTSADDDGAIATVISASVNGQAKNVIKETAPPSVLPMNFLLQDPGTSDGAFVPTQAGSYTVTATALPPFGPAVTEQKVFRVLAAGGSTTSALPGRPGAIFVAPKNGQKGVPVTVFPVITFSEPVTKVLGNVKLLDGQGNPGPALRLAGVGVNTAGEAVVLDTITPTSKVTSLTIEPVGGLKFGETYRLVVTSDVEDLDQPTPSAFVPFESTFETFAPEAVGGSADQTQMVGLAVMDDRAYALETEYLGGVGASQQNGILHIYDVNDPLEPKNIPPGARIIYPPRDIAVLKQTSSDGQGNETTQKLVALAASSRTYWQLQGEIVYYNELVSSPANLFIYNVDVDENPRWVGAVSLTQNILDGYPNRIAMDGNSVFVATARKGIQIVSLASAMSGFEEELGIPVQATEIRKQLFSGGYRMHAVVQTIPMTTDPPSSSVLLNLNDLKVGHLALDGTAARLVFATGLTPAVALVMVNPDTTEKIYQGKLEGLGGSLNWGSAIAVAQVAGRSLALVGGSATIAGASTSGVAVVDVSNPRAFQVLGWVKIGHSIGDIIVKDAIAIVAGDKGSKAPDGTLGVATLINLANPDQPYVSGTLAGVGTRMALAPNSILLSTQRDYLKGNATELNGVKTAALGNLAIVEGTTPGRVVVGDGPRSAEDFKLKFRVIPSTYEVNASKIEFRIADQTIGAPIDVTMTNGRGELPLPLGYTFRKAGQVVALPRLVINEGTADELVSAPRPWNTEQPIVRAVWTDREIESESPLAPKEEAVTADHTEIGVEVISPEWFRRSREPRPGEDPVMRQVNWEAQSSPASTRAGATLSDDGFFATTLDTTGQAGQARSVIARVGDVVLGTTGPVIVEPGAAATVTLTSAGDRTALPADKTTTVLLTLEARDVFGNLVADGTAVTWAKGEGTDGTLLEGQDKTKDGRATVIYRAGIRLGGEHKVIARLDRAVGEFVLQQRPIGIQLLDAPAEKDWFDRSMPVFTVRLTSTGGDVANGAPIAWFSSVGRMVVTQEVQGGIAKAKWDFSRVTHRPRVYFTVTLGGGLSQHRMTWTGPASYVSTEPPPTRRASAGAREVPGGGMEFQEPAPGSPVVSVAPLAIAGDLTQDQMMPLELSDGSTEMVPVKATATYRIAGLQPGEHVRVQLGTSARPNVPPVAHYTGDAILEATLPDLTGLHEGKVTGGVSVEEGGYIGDALHFDGTGVVRVSDHKEFAFPGAFIVQTAVKPPPDSAAQTLLDKAGDFRLDLVEQNGQLHPRFTVTTEDGEESITSPLPVPTGAWSLITGTYRPGTLWVGIDKAKDYRVLSQPPIHNKAELVLGPGFTGSLDEIKLIDLGKAPLSNFANGQQSVAFVADATGVFETQIVSTGVMGNERVAGYYLNLAFAARGMAQDVPFPDALQNAAGFIGTSAEVFYEDRAASEESDIKYALWMELAFTVKFTRGLFLGAEGETDPAVLAGDFLGSLFVLRDFINSSGRALDGEVDGARALDIAVGLFTLLERALGKKLILLKGARNLAKVIARGGPSSRALARLIALEAKITAGAAGVSRIRKLLEVAQIGLPVATALAGLLDHTGDDEEAAEHLSNTLDNAGNDQEVQAVVAELGEMRGEVPPDEFRALLRAVGTPTPEGSPSAAGSAPRRFVKLTRKALKGVRISGKFLKEAPGGINQYSKHLTNQIKLNHPENFTEIWEKIDDLILRVNKLDPNTAARINGNLHRMLRDLGSNHEIRRNAALLTLRVAHAIPDTGLIFESFQKFTAANGKLFRRFPDILTSTGKWIEIKAWSNWLKFPPPVGSRLATYVNAAEQQILRTIALKGDAAATELVVYFPKLGIGQCCEAAVRQYFTNFFSKKETIDWIAKFRQIPLADADKMAKNLQAAVTKMFQFQ